MKNQESAIKELQAYANSRSQAIIISGSRGCGKTWLAKKYAEMLRIGSFSSVDVSVKSIREVIQELSTSGTESVVCIENLDCGVADAANSLLKFVEEPPNGVFIVITCRDSAKVPDTIHSRCHRVFVPRMDRYDIEQYAKQQGEVRLRSIKDIRYMWDAVESTRDIDYLYSIGMDKITELGSLPQYITSNATVSNISWKLQRFSDGSKINVSFLIRMIMHYAQSNDLRLLCIRCLEDLDSSAMPEHIILIKFIVDLKY